MPSGHRAVRGDREYSEAGRRFEVMMVKSDGTPIVEFIGPSRISRPAARALRPQSYRQLNETEAHQVQVWVAENRDWGEVYDFITTPENQSAWKRKHGVEMDLSSIEESFRTSGGIPEPPPAP